MKHGRKGGVHGFPSPSFGGVVVLVVKILLVVMVFNHQSLHLQHLVKPEKIGRLNGGGERLASETLKPGHTTAVHEALDKIPTGIGKPLENGLQDQCLRICLGNRCRLASVRT